MVVHLVALKIELFAKQGMQEEQVTCCRGELLLARTLGWYCLLDGGVVWRW